MVGAHLAAPRLNQIEKALETVVLERDHRDVAVVDRLALRTDPRVGLMDLGALGFLEGDARSVIKPINHRPAMIRSRSFRRASRRQSLRVRRKVNFTRPCGLATMTSDALRAPRCELRPLRRSGCGL